MLTMMYPFNLICTSVDGSLYCKFFSCYHHNHLPATHSILFCSCVAYEYDNIINYLLLGKHISLQETHIPSDRVCVEKHASLGICVRETHYPAGKHITVIPEKVAPETVLRKQHTITSMCIFV